MASAKACSMSAVARPLAPVVDTAAEAADTAVETAAEIVAEEAAERAAEKAVEEAAEEAIEKIVERAAERATERVAEKAARPMMLLKIEPELMALGIEMIDIDDISDFESPSLRPVKLTL